MPAWTGRDGWNWADEVTYKLLTPNDSRTFTPVSLDEASGKVVTGTEVCPATGHVTIYLKNIKDCFHLSHLIKEHPL
jgi:hypothetical protein